MKKITYLSVFLLFLFLAVGVKAYFISKAGETIESRSLADLPKLTGPDRLCNVFGSILADYSGGGDPTTDVYKWKIYNPSNTLVFDRGGGALFETITFTFSGSGTFRVELIVERGGLPIYSDKIDVDVVLGPTISLKPNYSFCSGDPVTMQALDPSSANFSEYLFEWKNSSGSIIGTDNELTVDFVDSFTVNFYFNNSSGERECESEITTKTSAFNDYDIAASVYEVCPDLRTTFTTSPAILGIWKYQKSGSSSQVDLGYGPSIDVLPNQQLSGVGDYTIYFEPDPNNNPSCLMIKSFDIKYYPQPEFVVYPAVDATDCDSYDGALTIEAITDLDYVFLDGLGISTPAISAGNTYTLPGLKSGTYTLIGVLGSCNNAYGSLVPLANPPLQYIFSIEEIVGESCLPNGKEDGSFLIKFTNPPSTGDYRIINKKGTAVEEGSFTSATEIPITIPGGIYYVEIYNNLDCNVPKSSEVAVPSLNQTEFFIPSSLTICQSYEFIPQTSQALDFTITYPDGTQETQTAGIPFVLTQDGEHKVVGILPNDSQVCPTEKILQVTLVEPVEFEPVLINQDCFGNMTYKANIFEKDPATVVFKWYNEADELVGTGQFLNPVSYGNFKLEVQPANSESCPIAPIEFVIKEPVLSVEVALEATKLCEFGPRAIVDLNSTFPEEITDIEWRRYDDLGNIEDLTQYKDQWQITADIAGVYEASVYSRIPSINKNCELGRQTIVLDLIPDKVPFDVPSELSICDPYSLVPNSAIPLEFELTFPDGKTEIKSWKEAFILDQEGTYTILGYDPNSKGPLCPDQKTFEVTINEPVQFAPILVNLSCTGEYLYEAEVSNYPSDQVDYFWTDPNGTIVSTSSQMTTSAYGDFSLAVQPTGSTPCEGIEVVFKIPIPILSLEVEIEAETLCPDQPDAALSIDEALGVDRQVEWWFTDLSNNQIALTAYTNKTEILALEEGTYQVKIFSMFDCLLGSDEVLVVRSTDQIRPVLEESYQICPKYDIGPTLNPGSFSEYEWYLEDRLVSTNPVFKPSQAGLYELIVYSTEGCAYQTSFEAIEECILQVSFPNAIQPGVADKGFLIYTNYLIDELEVFIFNKWGIEVFHCVNNSLVKDTSTCIWDGYYDGKKALPGTYAIRVNYRNVEKNIREYKLGSVFVVD